MAEGQPPKHEKHILLLPFMAQGHLNPTIALAMLLQKRCDHTITLVSTPLNVQRLRSALPPAVRFTELSFNSRDHGLPPDCENTDSLPPHLVLRFAEASEKLQPAFERLVSSICRQSGDPSSSICIISDEFMSWSVQTAEKFQLFHSIIFTGGAYGNAVYVSLWMNFPHNETDSDEFELPDFPGVHLRKTGLSKDLLTANARDPWVTLFRKHENFFHQSDGILVNTVQELDSRGLDYIKRRFSKKVWCIGPSLRFSASPSSSADTLLVQWLNLHPPGSVLYVAFGSQNTIHPWQMIELAKGLEASGKPFIWVVGPPIGSDVNEEFKTEWLPEGFEDRVVKERKQGLLVRNWAPQLEILSHKATGAFLSHCGWNSILESLIQGVPIIGWPLDAEQPYNSKFLVEQLGVEIEMASGLEAEIHGIDVADMVKLILDEDSRTREELKQKAKQIGELMKAAVSVTENRKGSSIEAVDDFIQTAMSHCR